MGCDIHAHVEVKIEGMWHHYSVPHIRRNYNLFAKMANVRNYNDTIIPIAKPRGLPPDPTFITWFDYTRRWEADAHSISWLNGEEMDELQKWIKIEYKERENLFYFEDEFGYIFGNGWNVKKYSESYPKGVEDARLVFWFDN